MSFQERILIVDDELNLLDGLKRLLGRNFDITFALGGKCGLDVMSESGPFAIIVTDMRMPEMDGLEFISEARKASPKSVYLMLTGNSDQKTAVDAVNQGRVFRFLSKPCSRETFEAALHAAMHEYRLREAERQLLECTLGGCVQALLQVLNLTHPRLFQRASRVSKLALWLARAVNDPDPWQVQAAAALAGIGCVALPDDLVEQGLASGQLTANEMLRFRQHAAIGAGLLATIPRLERISSIVRTQYALAAPGQDIDAGDIDPAVAILATADALDNCLRDRKPWNVACREVCGLPYVNQILATALAGSPPEWIHEAQACKTKIVPVTDIRPGMILQEDVKTTRGELLIAAGNEVTEMLAERLRNFAKAGRTTKPIVVFDPSIRTAVLPAAA